MNRSMTSAQIREKFFRFFTQRKHEQVPSSSLIPAQDPTLLFANAGMNQFKDLFLAKEKRQYTRAVSIQKCVRAGGKHNDLDNVGFTKRHLTFFEMMGNFSFGDYFKKDAVRFAWDFITQDIGLSPDTLYASVYEQDDETYTLWQKEIGLPQSRIIRLGAADNFWQMGDTGPCGPCSEIYVDRGLSFGCKKKECAPGCSCDRFLEIWNLVFMQFDRQADGSLVPLAQTGVDTGMGLERLCAVVQGVDSVFHTDLFMPIIAYIEQRTGLVYVSQDAKKQAAFHVLADHIRSAALLIADGATPANEGRGYVLRKIIRRAALFAQKITDENIFPDLLYPLADTLGAIYPDLVIAQKKIHALLALEVERFALSLHRGQGVLESFFVAASNKCITGEQAFKLYDTYGFPLELIRIIAGERGFEVDIAGFEEEMEKQRAQSGKKQVSQVVVAVPVETVFTGYDELVTQSVVAAIICDDVLVDTVPAGTVCWIIPERSPFYVECGGQVNDRGWISCDDIRVSITGLRKFDGAIAVQCTVPVVVRVGMRIIQEVDTQVRESTMKNHTATHLLQAALMQLFGSQVRQSGSLVCADYLRFDFTYHETVSAAQVVDIERVVNQKIQENIPVSVTYSTQKEAVDKGVIAFFGEKYNPENVRIVAVPGFSAELCGGTHVRATGDIGVFKIIELNALSAGNKRIVALTGLRAVEKFQTDAALVKLLCQEFKVQPEGVAAAVEKQQVALQQARVHVAQLKKQQLMQKVPELIARVYMVGKVPFAFIEVLDVDASELKDLTSALLAVKEAFYVLVCSTDVKSSFVAAIGKSLEHVVDLVQFKDWAQRTLLLKGGGNKQLIQGGGPRFDPAWQAAIEKWLSA